MLPQILKRLGAIIASCVSFFLYFIIVYYYQVLVESGKNCPENITYSDIRVPVAHAPRAVHYFSSSREFPFFQTLPSLV